MLLFAKDGAVLLLELFMLSSCVKTLLFPCVGLPLHPIPLAVGTEEGCDWMCVTSPLATTIFLAGVECFCGDEFSGMVK